MRRALFAFLLCTHAAYAQEDVGLVNLVAGDPVYQAGSAKAYMRVREGDRFDLPAGVTSAEISFRPAARMALAYTAWAAILVSLGLLAAIVVRARRRGTRDASG